MTKWWRTNLPWFVIGGAFVWSCLAIASYRAKEAPPGTKITLRIAHWQLEAGVREALDKFAAEYRKLHPEVHIVQDAIPEQTYGQWLTTQLMGGTASDMIEVGLGLPDPVWIQYQQRYFLPITPYVNRVNPYNAGTEHANLPWRQTFRDGMRGGWVAEMEEFVRVPLSQFSMRVFYNRRLLEKLTGRREAPRTYRQFIETCAQIAAQQNPKGEPYVPIAGSKYHIAMWDSMMLQPVTFPALRRLDFNRDGDASKDEIFVGFATGRIDLNFPAYRAKFQMLRELTSFFQSGYTGLTRDDAVLLFAQERAVFMSTGTWDAFSLRDQAQGRFEVGVMEFPMPTRDDPQYGPLIEGPAHESPDTGFAFGITRTCQHPEVALDFLMFLASRDNNGELNRRIGWIPSILGAPLDPDLRAFEPRLEGVRPALDFNLGGETYIKWLQLYSLYQVQQVDFDSLAREFEPFYRERGQRDFAEFNRNRIRGMQRNEQFLAAYRARALAASGEAAKSLWSKYRSLTHARLIWPEQSSGRLQALLLAGPATNSPGPGEYRPAVLARARERFRAEAKP